MESHPLNMAHQQYRRAEAHLKYNRFDEAIQCHQNAAELLLDAMKYSTSSVALESLSIQHSYHLKQKDIVKSKKERYARIKKSMENMKLLSKDPYINVQGNDHTKLQVAIYKTLNESEALLDNLSTNEKTLENRISKEADVVDGTKKEKPQQLIIEELQILSQSLHSLVEQLVLQVEILKDENATLNDKVNYLEKERVKYLNISTQNALIDGINLSEVGSTFSHSLIPDSNMASLEQINKQVHFDFGSSKKDNF